MLVKFVRPLQLKYTILKESALDKNEEMEKIAVGESFERDCIYYIKLANSIKLRTTKGSGLPAKASMIKINEVLVNKEMLIDADSLSDYRVIEQTFRIYGLSQILLYACVLEDADGVLKIGPKANDFLKLNHAGKCRMLLKEYLEADGIFELERIREIKVRTDSRPKLTRARNVVLKYLCACPVNGWVDLSELLRFIRKIDRKFLTSLVGEIETYSDYERYYSSGNHSWNEVEGRFVQVILLEYLSVMGIVDLMVEEDCDDYGEKVYYSVNYLRLTPLGAYVLGVIDDYQEPEKEVENSGIIIQPNYEVVVVSGGMQDVHLLFLDRFAEKVSEGAVNVYKLSFKAVVSALDQAIPVQELIDYFQEFSINPIPENVLLTLQEWERESKKIRIRTVTILETDDQYLLEELKSYKTIRHHIRNELPYVLEIDGKSTNKLKREIEKKNRLCLMEQGDS
ncbi:MAG: helicase-associated domain-containing protein [Bacillota bacterium]|nr:helicase-associated domain-containing protein [Bacillota bacterium]